MKGLTVALTTREYNRRRNRLHLRKFHIFLIVMYFTNSIKLVCVVRTTSFRKEMIVLVRQRRRIKKITLKQLKINSLSRFEGIRLYSEIPIVKGLRQVMVPWYKHFGDSISMKI